MKLYKDKREGLMLYSSAKNYHGRYKKSVVHVRESVSILYPDRFGKFYFTVAIPAKFTLGDNVKNTHNYNSLWDNLCFDTKEEATEMAMKYIDEFRERERNGVSV